MPWRTDHLHGTAFVRKSRKRLDARGPVRGTSAVMGPLSALKPRLSSPTARNQRTTRFQLAKFRLTKQFFEIANRALPLGDKLATNCRERPRDARGARALEITPVASRRV